MNVCFGDTSYFLSLLIRDDEFHAKAFRWASTSRMPIVTTEYIVMEVGNFLASSPSRALFSSFIQTVRTNPRLTLVPASPDLFRRGVELYLERSDKFWSLTDCTSFVTMRDRRLTNALSADHHFEQAGFVALLRGDL